MTSESNAKRKSDRSKKSEPKLVITEWAVEEAVTPNHVSVSFVTHQESMNGVSRDTTRRFRLRREQAVALVNELKGLLDASAEFRWDEQGTATVLPFCSTRVAERSKEQDLESLSNPFALGAGYGLLGN